MPGNPDTIDTQSAFYRLIARLVPSQEPEEARAMARIVLEDVFHWRRGQRPRELSPVEMAKLASITERLLAGEPVKYVVGQAHFFDIVLRVTPDVLIPRPETEELVEWALEWLKDKPAGAQVLDIGTGSGCIAITIAKHRPDLRVTAIDVSPEALSIATENAEANEVVVDFHQVDILDEAARQEVDTYDFIVSNPPYIPHHERILMSPSVLAHEPELALFVGNNDALIFYREILDFAETHLRSGGAVLFECNEFMAQATLDLATDRKWSAELRLDFVGSPRMLLAFKP